jgi:ATP-dependent DNA helicase RecG
MLLAGSRQVNLAGLHRLIAEGEGPNVELKRTTGELREGLESVCAFLNTAGGTVLFGVTRKGTPDGQQVSEQTIHEVASAFERFEPPAVVDIERIKVGEGREVIALSVRANHEGVPYTFDGRAFERIGNTTRKMSQEHYETLLLERAHARRRWENQPAVGVRIRDLDREEILRTRELAIQQGRISAGTGRRIEDVLDRLGLRQGGVLTQAAFVLYGTRFLPDYPQCKIKMGRFRGTDVTGEIVDNRQEHLHAFAMVREGMAFLERTMPLGARFPEGKIFREDRFPIPPEAIREVLLNAIMHRDYADPGGYVAIAVFDDRMEISSFGRLPAGLTTEMLSRTHLSKLRNLLIAETFHRTGAVEIWGRGTNRVIAACKRHGAAPPIFEERQGFLIVTFRAMLAGGTEPGSAGARSGAQSGAQSDRILSSLSEGELSARAIAEAIGVRGKSGALKRTLSEMLSRGLIEYALPEKPTSRLQRYRLTPSGREALKRGSGENGAQRG